MNMTECYDNKKQKYDNLERSFERTFITFPPSYSQQLSIADILSCIRDEKTLLTFKAIASSENNDTDILITKLRLTRKQYYSSMEKLTNANLVRRISGKYRLTSFGKVIFSIQTKVEAEIETAIKHYWELKALDSIMIDMSTHDKESFLQQRQKIMSDLIDNNEIRSILLSR